MINNIEEGSSAGDAHADNVRVGGGGAEQDAAGSVFHPCRSRTKA